MGASAEHTDPREPARLDWLKAQGITADLCPLPADASPRRYFRASGTGMLLVQVPPDDREQPVFTQVADHLARLGLSAPETRAADPDAGFYLVEDFGTRTFSAELSTGHSEHALYTSAIDAIIHLHGAPDATAIDLRAYDSDFLLSEALIFADWFAPKVNPRLDSKAFRKDFAQLWHDAIRPVGQDRSALVLRDLIFDNLIHLPGRTGVKVCGLIDVQGARIGAPEYDLGSLLQDARRDLEPGLEGDMLARYLAAHPQDGDRFRARYALLAAQRHTKIAGLFVRLAVRDAKPAYLRHMPRVLARLDTALDGAGLVEIRALMEHHIPGWQTAQIAV